MPWASPARLRATTDSRAALSGEPTDLMVFALTAAGVALTALLGYVIPAFGASRVEPAVALRGVESALPVQAAGL